jgi:hypothetical protein
MGGIKSKINLVQLAKEIKVLNTRKELYYVLKEELEKIGYWKQKKRGINKSNG